MWANNETGVIFDIPAIAALARRHGAVFHCDAIQAVGKLPIKLRDLPIDLLSLSAHKFHGPKGVGALYVRRGLRWSPFLRGGPQERERRGGTENVPGIVGLGAAAQLAASNMPAWTHVAALRDRLEQGLLQRIPDTHINGDPAARVPNTTNIGFAGVQAEAVLLLLSEQDVCASAGAACASGSLEPSHVLRAMHLPDRIAHGAVRFSLSHLTTPEEIDRTLQILPPSSPASAPSCTPLRAATVRERPQPPVRSSRFSVRRGGGTVGSAFQPIKSEQGAVGVNASACVQGGRSVRSSRFSVRAGGGGVLASGINNW